MDSKGNHNKNTHPDQPELKRFLSRSHESSETRKKLFDFVLFSFRVFVIRFLIFCHKNTNIVIKRLKGSPHMNGIEPEATAD